MPVTLELARMLMISSFGVHDACKVDADRACRRRLFEALEVMKDQEG
jgi:hypothetical protein